MPTLPTLAINGFGRIGRAAFKVAHALGAQVVAINDLTPVSTLAHLLTYDSVYGKFNAPVSYSADALIVDEKEIPVTAEKNPALLPWSKTGADVVLECTGKFRTKSDALAHISAGAGRVIISAPADKDVPTIVRGVNDDIDWSHESVVNNASCTTNSLAPVMALLDAQFGIAASLMSTIHSYTADQTLVDGPHSDLRRARGAAQSIIPTSTGAAIAVTEALPHLKNLFDGLSFRVPTPVVSVSDITVLLKKATSADQINEMFRDASKDPRYSGIIAVSDLPLVSMDFKGNPASGTIDTALTQVVNDTLAKIVVWYDNEWGYANRLVELALKLGRAHG